MGQLIYFLLEIYVCLPTRIAGVGTRLENFVQVHTRETNAFGVPRIPQAIVGVEEVTFQDT